MSVNHTCIDQATCQGMIDARDQAIHRQAGIIADLVNVGGAALNALRSYQYGNASTDLAESVANSLQTALAKAGASCA